MDYQRFSEILNRHIFGSERHKMFDVLTKHPERFVGLFRPYKPESKLLQYLLWARGIKLGDGIEEALREMLRDRGYHPQDRHIGPELECDQYFLAPDGKWALLIEQKLRDDHNSTKRIGQWENFRKKVKVLQKRHGKRLIAAMYFVDPSMNKNKCYYEQKIEALRRELELPSIYLWYGKESFAHLDLQDDWNRLKEWLKQWKADLPIASNLNCEIGDAPDEMRKLAQEDPKLWDRLAECQQLWEESIVKVLFPTGSGLQEVIAELRKADAMETAEALEHRLNQFYR